MIPPSKLGKGWRRSFAFSLVELLIVVAIMFTLMVLVYGGSSRSRQQRKISACQQNLRVIAAAFQIYAGDHSGRLPATATPAKSSDEPLSLLVPRYTSLTAPFICPGTRDKALPEGQPFRGRRISYSYYMGESSAASTQGQGPGARGQESGVPKASAAASAPALTDWQVNTRLKIAGDPLFSSDGKSPGNNHDRYGGNILFADGHAEKSPPRASIPLPLAEGVVLLNPR